MLTRDLSAPLFAAQTQSLREWAANLTRIREDGKSISQEYGEKIAKAFTVIKDASGGIAQHWKLIAGMLVAGKVGGMMKGALGAFGVPAGAAGGAAGGLMGGAVASMTVNAGTVSVNSGGLGGALGAATATGIEKSLKPSLGESVRSFTALASKGFIAAEILGGLAVAGAAAIDAWQSAKLETQRTAPIQTMTALSAAIKTMQAKTSEDGLKHLKTVAETYGLKPGQHVAGSAVAAGLKELDPAQRLNYANKFGVKGDMASATASGFAEEAGRKIADRINQMFDMAFKNYGGAMEEKTDKEKAKKAVGDIHVGTVNITQDFKEANPEHVFHQVISDINQLGHMPGQALTARGGR
jgi:hypothetical protein